MKDKTITVITAGTEIVGTLTTTALALLGGPFGAIAGGIVGTLVNKGLAEVCDRYLSNREVVRIGAATSYMLEGFESKRQSNLNPRDDDFFDSRTSSRSNAEELFEGTLLKCKTSYEEAKIKYLSRLFVNVAYDKSVSTANANHLIYIVEQLSYQQLLLITLIHRNAGNKYVLLDEDYNDVGIPDSIDAAYILQSIITLNNIGIMQRNDDTTMLDGFAWIAPAKLVLTLIGEELYRLLDLSEIPEEELELKHYLLPGFGK
jgi:hypothetical protein